jgi:hypothetical protein
VNWNDSVGVLVLPQVINLLGHDEKHNQRIEIDRRLWNDGMTLFFSNDVILMN